MPCCQKVLSAAAAASRTPSWLHRLHAKEGLSFPSNLQLDDLLYGGRRAQPTPPPPTSNRHPNSAVVKMPPPPKAAKPMQQQLMPPRNPSRPNPSSSNSPQPQPQLQLTAVISDVFATPSSVPPDTPALKAFRKQSRPRPRTGDEPNPASPSRPRKDKKDRIAAKAKKHRRAERAMDADGEKRKRTDVTVIDTSTQGWKAAKVLIRRGDAWKVRNKKPSAASEHEDAVAAKGKRKAGLVSKLQRDREKQKGKEAASSSYALCLLEENGYAGSDFVVEESEEPHPNSE